MLKVRMLKPRYPSWSSTVLMLAVIGGLVIPVVAATAQNPTQFEGRLTPVPVDGVTRDLITGIGSLSAVLEGTRLTITGSFEGLRDSATEANVHRGLATGVRGTAFFELTVSRSTSGDVSGSLDLNPDQIESLREGRLYVQIHSEIAPEGNLWGWLLQ
jgi:hypothetical protein